MMRGLLICTVFTLALGGAFADPLPQGADAPSAPDTPVPSDKAQPPPVTEQNDVPPVAPPPVQAQEGQPAADKPTDDAASKPSAEQKAEEVPKNVEPVAPTQAFSILGKKVHGADGKDALGSIIDVLIDDQGQPRAAIIDFGGFLGVGSRKIAVDWKLLKFQPADHAVPIVLDLDRSQIQAAPEYKDPTQPAEVVEQPLVDVPLIPPVPEVAETPATSDLLPLAPPIPPHSVAVPAPAAVPAPPSSDAAASPNADKHAN